MSILEEMHKPDILDCISHLSSDEVFTPPKLVNQILDILPQELFKSPDTKFLDPCCKSGVFLREIAKRLIDGLEDKIPNLDERVEHIFKNQLYGLAITELTALLSRRSVYCSKDASGEYSVANFDNNDGNIEYKRTYHLWLKDKCMMCGACKTEYDRPDILETHAYSFIHTDEIRNKELFERLKNMKFDVIIGNPPYQLSDGGHGASAIPIYNLFVEQAKKLNPRYITMIIPARWYAGGRGLDSFRDEMLKDDRIRILVDYPISEDCFPGVNIEGGVCYFLWNREERGICNVRTYKNNEKVSELERPLLEKDCKTFIRYNNAISILRKVQKFQENKIEEQISSMRPFGLRTYYDEYIDTEFENSIKVFARGGSGYIDTNIIKVNRQWISKYKIIISRAYGMGNTQPYQVINKPINAGRNSCCTETYIVLGNYDDATQAKNLYEYVKTRFFRFLVLLKKNTQDAPKHVYSFVPLQDFNEEWTDEKLYKKYGLTQEEIDFIESMIRPMD